MRFDNPSKTNLLPFLGLVLAALIATLPTESAAQQHSDQDLTTEPPTGDMPADETSTAPAPGPATAVVPGPDAILRQLEARREMGLVADADMVAELLLHPDDHGAVDGFGAYLLPSEWARVRELWMVSQQLQLVDDFVRQRGLDDIFGSAWMDWTDGVVRVAFTEDAELHVAELRTLFPYPERLAAVPAEHSLAELIAVQQELVSQLDDLQAQGIDVTTSSIDEVAGRVDVRVSVPTDAAVTELGRRFGADRIRVEQGPQLSTWSRRSGAIEDSRRDGTTYGTPLRGGLLLRSYQSWNDTYYVSCTSGFMAIGPSASRWMTTAGHCYPDNGVVYQGVTRIDAPDGYIYRRINPLTRRNEASLGGINGNGSTQSDVAAVQIPLSLSSPWIYVHPNDYAHHITLEQQTSQDRVGDRTCIAGIYSPGADSQQYCGELLNRFFQGRTDRGAIVTNLRQSTLDCRRGDSGSAIYSAHVANGILSGGIDENRDGDSYDAGETCVYSHVQRALADIGLDTIE